ncbi:ATP-binding cassette domain-containing protein [Pelagicoccus sp. SDUM812003]|uniref:ATP-binding cassette domain-containing protein n=1 Tax=Pelagicoccus sp. SDUM812003 TaxID=3041267 RepID=UPI00280D9987|nr:ATP-binding cassette domain-containing protein [Pelagicoccus sp. SDUM812003]MDQ8203899.1 ATP-binding cassette domain-containing protein [Pelagicoccus sp. SDUM812003]
MTLRDIRYGPLLVDSLDIALDQPSCILGPNASGKSLLAELIAAEREPESGSILDRPPRVRLLSFESLQRDFEAELANDDTDFLDRIDYGTTGRELLLESGAAEETIERAAKQFGLVELLERGCRQFSSGELRRITLLKAILAEPDLLILDEPFESLDAESRQTLDGFLKNLSLSGQALLLFVNALSEVPSWISRLAVLQAGRIVATGDSKPLLASSDIRKLFSENETATAAPEDGTPSRDIPPILVSLRNGRVAYSDTVQFEGLDWTLRQGEHTLITGPNGCGKSTLLSLVTGDHPQCYVNDLTVFGHRRGSGESIWDIKRHIGIVSPALHRDYRVSASVRTVVLSGYFDSIGLYQQPSSRQLSLTEQWLRFFDLAAFAAKPFRNLSFGQQRLALIARALAKAPPLLILDEPTLGLDARNRSHTLRCLERLAELKQTTLLFVSHREDERLSLFRQHLRFHPDASGRSRYLVRQAKPPA